MSGGRKTSPTPVDPRLRLADAVRTIITQTVSSELDDEALGDAAEALEAIGERLADRTTGKRAREQPDMSRPVQEYFPTSPISGLINPVAPPVQLTVVDGPEGGYREIHAEVTFDYPYEGPPTCVHGGVIAATFDEILGAANIVAGNPGMTGTLTIRYRKPTPLRTPLRIEARCVDRTGRKTRTWGGIYHGDVLTAEAEGIFIEVPPGQILAIAEGNIDNADLAVVEAIRTEATRIGAASDFPGPAQPRAGSDS
ncbi:MAG: PaaI family thioesterase [Acidimicrobiales bacterium]